MISSQTLADRNMKDQNSELTPVTEVDWDVATDVLIIGAGGCGLSASLAASENSNLTATILEKESEIGGNTAMSTGMIPAAGTSMQREANIEEKPSDMAADILEKCNYEADEERVQYLCEQAANLIHWLVNNCGVELTFVDDVRYPRQSEYRMHSPPGRQGKYIIDDLHTEVETRKNIELLTNTPVNSLVTDNSKVVGVIAGEKRIEAIEADIVVLATDGFGSNSEMVQNNIGKDAADLLYYGAEGNTGDGIRWGDELGAKTANMDAYQGHATVMVESGLRSRYTNIMHGAIIVDEYGERIGDESKGYSAFVTDFLNRTENGIGYKILDQRIYNLLVDKYDDYEDQAESYRYGEDIESLAIELDIDPEKTRATIRRYNSAAENNDPDETGRDERLHSLQPPFYGVAVRPALFHTQGGLVVNKHGQVVSNDGNPFNDLYAGGGAAVGISGSGNEGYSSGNGLLTAFSLGYLIGTHIRNMNNVI
jgi:fumarate reductase flavoprotein subunit